MHLDFEAWAENEKLVEWIEEVAKLCTPDSVHFYQGTPEEYASLCKKLEKENYFIKLDPKLRPGSYLCRTDPDDVARVEEATFICTQDKKEAGPTNNWRDPLAMKKTLHTLFQGCMKGRTMYVVPFCMGPLHSPFSLYGVEITDSPYVVINMQITTDAGLNALKALKNGHFIPCLHSVGCPLEKGERDAKWPCNREKLHIVHFPEEKSIYSFGSGYGGNALLGKKCLALRIASFMAKEEGWLAEHMLIMGIENAEGVKKYIAAAFPSACGKTNLAMLQPAIPGWKITCVGDDIAWMRWGKDGRLYAVNPEKGFFGVAPGTSMKTNPMMMRTMARNTIFTNVALTENGDVWWEGKTDVAPEALTTWKSLPYDPKGQEKAAHPNARFTTPAAQCPIIDPLWQSPEGVPISAILFGGRRSSNMPLVMEAFNWKHGVYLGASLVSETTAAAKGEVGKLRHDPFAMLPFCGYNMAEYFAHWFSMEKPGRKMPKIYCVNWFGKDMEGKYLWPGFGENIRVLKWIFDRCQGRVESKPSILGNIPLSLDLSNLSVDSKALFAVGIQALKEMAKEQREYFAQFGDTLPKEILDQIDQLEKRIELNPAAL